jgi:hypothetical protein
MMIFLVDTLRDASQTFNITYLAGSAMGSIVWDSVTIGPDSVTGYQINNQALGEVHRPKPYLCALQRGLC